MAEAGNETLKSQELERCFGGLILTNEDGLIVCKNTLDARLQLAYQQMLPIIRRELFNWLNELISDDENLLFDWICDFIKIHLIDILILQWTWITNRNLSEDWTSSNRPFANIKNMKSQSSNKNLEMSNSSKEIKFLTKPVRKTNPISTISKKTWKLMSKSPKVEKSTSPECLKWNSDTNLSNAFRKILKMLSLKKSVIKESTESSSRNSSCKDSLRCLNKKSK